MVLSPYFEVSKGLLAKMAIVGLLTSATLLNSAMIVGQKKSTSRSKQKE